MMPNNTAVKSTAKATLKSIWPQSVAICVILGVVVTFSSCIQSIIYMLSSEVFSLIFAFLFFFFVTAPLIMGILFWVWRVTVLSDSSVLEAFFPFSTRYTYARTIFFVLSAFFRLAIILLLCLFPFALIKLASAPEVYEVFGGQMPVWTANLLVFANFFKVVGITLFVVLASRFYLAPLLYMIGGDITPAEAIFMSRKIGAFSYGQMLLLALSFLGWAVLSVLIIPAIYTLPYFLVCFIVHCRYAINYYNNKLNQKGFSYTPPNEDFGANL